MTNIMGTPSNSGDFKYLLTTYSIGDLKYFQVLHSESFMETPSY